MTGVYLIVRWFNFSCNWERYMHYDILLVHHLFNCYLESYLSLIYFAAGGESGLVIQVDLSNASNSPLHELGCPIIIRKKNWDDRNKSDISDDLCPGYKGSFNPHSMFVNIICHLSWEKFWQAIQFFIIIISISGWKCI